MKENLQNGAGCAWFLQSEDAFEECQVSAAGDRKELGQALDDGEELQFEKVHNCQEFSGVVQNCLNELPCGLTETSFTVVVGEFLRFRRFGQCSRQILEM